MFLLQQDRSCWSRDGASGRDFHRGADHNHRGLRHTGSACYLQHGLCCAEEKTLARGDAVEQQEQRVHQTVIAAAAGHFALMGLIYLQLLFFWLIILKCALFLFGKIIIVLHLPFISSVKVRYFPIPLVVCVCKLNIFTESTR